jgi:hypothetical protein
MAVLLYIHCSLVHRVLGQKQLQKERLALAVEEFSDEIQRHSGDETERQSAVVNLEEGE